MKTWIRTGHQTTQFQTKPTALRSAIRRAWTYHPSSSTQSTMCRRPKNPWLLKTSPTIVTEIQMHRALLPILSGLWTLPSHQLMQSRTEVETTLVCLWQLRMLSVIARLPLLLGLASGPLTTHHLQTVLSTSATRRKTTSLVVDSQAISTRTMEPDSARSRTSQGRSSQTRWARVSSTQ